MVFEKKQLSKALVIALVVACAVAFMPLLNGQAFAASKVKKAKITSFEQNDTMTAGSYTVTAKWNKAKNAKKYKVIIKEDGTAVLTKTVKKSVRTISYDKAAVGKTYVVSVQSINGKKKAKAATKELVVVDKRANITLAPLTYDGDWVVGAKVTAAVNESAAKVSWQWYRGTTAIAGATNASYTTTVADQGFALKVVATVDPADPAYIGSVEASTPKLAQAPKGDFFARTTPVWVGATAEVVKGNATITATPTYAWYHGSTKIAGAASATYDVGNFPGEALSCIVTYRLPDATADSTMTVDFGTIAKHINTSYPTLGVVSDGKVVGTTNKVKAGATVTAALYDGALTEGAAVPTTVTSYAETSPTTYTWTYHVVENNKSVAKTTTGKTITIDADLADQNITVAAVVAPGSDNYAGEYSAVTFTTLADTVDRIEVSGTTKVGETLTATVYGKLGEIKNATVNWQVDTALPVSSNDGAGKFIVPANAVGKQIRAVVGDKNSAWTAEVAKGDISKVEITKYTKDGDIEATLDNRAATATYCVSTFYDSTTATEAAVYGSSTKVAGVDVAAAKAGYKQKAGSSWTATPGHSYGVKVAVNSDYFNVAEGTVLTAPIVTTKVLQPITAVNFTMKKADGTTVTGTVRNGYTLEAEATPEAAAPTWKWYRHSTSSYVEDSIHNVELTADGNKYTVKAEDIGYYITAVADGEANGYGTQAATTTKIYDTALPVATIKMGTKVGDECTATKATGAQTPTYRWVRNGSTAVGNAATYTLQNADYGATITCTVTPAVGDDAYEAVEAQINEVAPAAFEGELRVGSAISTTDYYLDGKAGASDYVYLVRPQGQTATNGVTFYEGNSTTALTATHTSSGGISVDGIALSGHEGKDIVVKAQPNGAHSEGVDADGLITYTLKWTGTDETPEWTIQ